MRFPIPGGIYGFALPDRTHGAMMEGHFIDTSNGRVELPGEGIARLDGARWRGQLFMAGEGGESGHAWLWTAGKWRELGPTHGVNCCAFGEGVLHIAISGDTYRTVNLDTFATTTHGPVPLGGQGIRYVNEQNVPVFGDATIGFDPAEFTVRGDVTVGQGHNGGTMINGRIIEPGQCFFPRFKRAGDALATYTVKFAEHQGVAHWITRAEVDTLPLPGAPPIVVIPPVVIVPPVKEPPPVSLQAPNQIEVVRRVMAEHPEIKTNSEATREAILPLVIAALGGFPWGRKSRNSAGTDLNTDAVTFRRQDGLFEIYDVIDSTTGGAFWDGFGPFKEGENGFFFTQPITPVPASTFAAAAAAVEARLTVLSTTLQNVQQKLAVVEQALASQKPDQTISLDGIKIALKTENGHYVSAEGGGGGILHTQRPGIGEPVESYTPGGWETFEIVTR